MSEVKFRSGVDQTGFERDLGSMQGKLGKFNSAVVGMLSRMAVPVSAGGIAAFTLRLADAADQLQDLADRYGESASGLQRVGSVARVTGTDLETVALASQRLRVSLVDAERGMRTQADALAAMGFSAKDLIGLELPDLMVKLSEGYAVAEQKGQGLWALQQLMGRGAGAMLAQLRMGPEALAEAYGAAASASDDAIRRMAAVASAWKNLKSEFMAGAIEIAAGIQAQVGGFLGSIWGFLTGGKKGADRSWRGALDLAKPAAPPKPVGSIDEPKTQEALTDAEKQRLALVSQRLEAEREASALALATDEQRLAILQRQLEIAQRAQVVEGADAQAAERVLNAAIREVQLTREIELTRRRIAESKQKDADRDAKASGASTDDRIKAFIDSGMSISQARRAVAKEDKAQRARDRLKDRYDRTKGDQASLFDNRPVDRASYIHRGSLIDEYGPGQNTRPGDVIGRGGAASEPGAGAAPAAAPIAGADEAAGGSEGPLSRVAALLEDIKGIMTRETE